MRQERGFTILELLVAVGIILVLVAIALPSILNSIRAGNETAAAATLRSLNAAEEGYRNMWGAYSPSAMFMGDSTQQCNVSPPAPYNSCDLSDTVLTNAGDSGATKDGYIFTRINGGLIPIAPLNMLAGGGSGQSGYLWDAVPNSIFAGRKEFCIYNGVTHVMAFNGTVQLNTPQNCFQASTL